MINNWYKTWFGNDYLTVYAHRDEKEAQQLIKLLHSHKLLNEDSKILDLCCGQGRHALLLAKEGYEVYGFDLSRTLLEIAKFRKSKKHTAYFVQADMRYLPANESFDLLLNLFTSFGYFENDEANRSVFCQFNQSLKENGYYVFDFLNVLHVVENLVPYQKEKIGDTVVELERFIEGSRVKKIIKLNRDGKGSIFHESVKMYHPNEILAMLESAGLSIKYQLGNYEGEPFDEQSPRFIIIGQKLKD